MRRLLDQGCYQRVPTVRDGGDWRADLFEDVCTIDADETFTRRRSKTRSRERHPRERRIGR